MKKNRKDSVMIPVILVPIAGLILLGACFALYFGIYMFIESTFYSTNMGGVPAEAIRLSLAAVLVVIFCFIMTTTKVPELIKAILMIAPLGVFLIAVILGFYRSPMLIIIGVVVIASMWGFWIYKSKRPWFFFYAELIAIAIALFYALPRG